MPPKRKVKKDKRKREEEKVPRAARTKHQAFDKELKPSGKQTTTVRAERTDDLIMSSRIRPRREEAEPQTLSSFRQSISLAVTQVPQESKRAPKAYR